MGGAPAGSIYLNQPAYEKINEAYASYFFLSEDEIEIKHEGKVICYRASMTNATYVPKEPSWILSETKRPTILEP